MTQWGQGVNQSRLHAKIVRLCTVGIKINAIDISVPAGRGFLKISIREKIGGLEQKSREDREPKREEKQLDGAFHCLTN